MVDLRMWMTCLRVRPVFLMAVVIGVVMPPTVAGSAVGGRSTEAVGGQSAVFGIWATSGTMIEVGPTSDGLSARIIALKHPHWREKDGAGRLGEPKTDLHNPDASMHHQPLIGLEMLSDYEFSKGRWRGTLYLPSNGTLWKSTARVKNGKLRIRGYVGLSMFGKTQTFEPLADCNEDILMMIDNARMTGTPCDALLAGSG